MALITFVSQLLFPIFFISEAHEKQTRELTSNIKDLQKAKEALMREVNELKTQLKMVEESRDNVRRELIEAHRKIREGIGYMYARAGVLP